MNQSVLIIESIIEKNDTDMEKTFRNNGFDVHVLNDLESALSKLKVLKPNIIIVDLDIAGMNGLDFCRDLRYGKNWTPVILLSSTRDELESVIGFELGADDYIVKPIRPKEIVARVKSILRRGELCCLDEQGYGTEGRHYDAVYKNGDLLVDPEHFMIYKDGIPVELTKKEFELFYYLFRNRGKVYSRSQLLKATSDESVDERIIDVFISRIRNKLEKNRNTPMYIRTIRNMGYMMKDFNNSSSLRKDDPGLTS